MDLQKEREAFEAWASEDVENFIDAIFDGKYYVMREKSRLNQKDKEFLILSLNRGWKAWQAAKAQAIPDGFVLVAKEPTPKMIAHITNTPIEVNLLCDHADVFLSEDEACIAYKAVIEAQEPAND